ncbi:hypothetical protein AAMO2058_000126600, partial [Amorphochlora amoebiformis]
TNRRNKGLISANRAKMALFNLQYLFHVKSSTRDLSLPMFEYTCNQKVDGLYYQSKQNYWPKAITNLYIGVQHIVAVQPGFGLRGVQP